MDFNSTWIGFKDDELRVEWFDRVIMVKQMRDGRFLLELEQAYRFSNSGSN